MFIFAPFEILWQKENYLPSSLCQILISGLKTRADRNELSTFTLLPDLFFFFLISCSKISLSNRKKLSFCMKSLLFCEMHAVRLGSL